MLCGTRSFSDVDDRSGRASSPRPKLSKLRQSLSLDRGRKQTSNPYSNEGLEKFEKLMAELEAKKEEVLLKSRGSDRDSGTIVRFRYNSDTGDWVPIVVRLQAEAKKGIGGSRERAIKKEDRVANIKQAAGKKAEIKKSTICRWSSSVRQYFWATMLGLVLLSCCFVILGRAFVVCSATILWYMVPMMSSDKWLLGNGWRNLGVATASPSSSSSSSSSVIVKKIGSDHVRRRSAVK